MDKNLIMLGILSYITVQFKTILLEIFNFLFLRFTFTIEANSNKKQLYLNLQTWLNELDNKIIRNNVTVQSHYKHGVETSHKSLAFGNYKFFHNGSLVMIKKERIENNFEIAENLKITIMFNIKSTINSLEKCLYNITDKNTLTVYPTRDVWYSIETPKRSFNTIFNNEKYKIINHLDKWKGSKDYYAKRELVYKTGILLYGIHGTGKSSIIKAMASYLGFNLHIINVSEYKEPTQLINRLTDITPNSLVVFEEIDCFVHNRETGEVDESSRVLAVLLNFLDGIYSIQDCVYVATTNHVDRLDEALIRDGRFDLKLEIKNIDKDNAIEMVESFGGDVDCLEGLEFPINPSKLQNIILKLSKSEDLENVKVK